MNDPTVPPMRHPLLELLRRYREVAASAWASRHDLAGPRLLAHEAAFLPAALAVQETPVHPAPRRAMAVIVLLFAVALAWSVLGEVDIVVVAPGRLVVSEGRQLVQPLETAVVQRILVRDGDLVEAGQLLVELDPSQARADAASLQAQVKVAADELARTGLLLRAMDTGLLPPVAHPEVQGEWREIVARKDRLIAEGRRREAEATTVQATLDKLLALLPLAQQREADTRELSSQGFVSGHSLQDRARERIEIDREIIAQRARLAEAGAALQEVLQSQAAQDAETRRGLQDRRLKAEQDQSQLQPQVFKGAHRERQAQLRAPVAGQVQELAVHSLGGVVTPAQTLMVVVPGAGRLQADVMVENKDIGYVHVGQKVAVKLEAFPFTRHGTVAATVSSISADAVVGEDNVARFKARVSLASNQLRVDGRTVQLGAGLNVTGEIKSGRRRLIHYFLDPILAYRLDALKER